MNKYLRIALIAISFTAPIALRYLLVIIVFFVYGESAVSYQNFEQDRYWWFTACVILALWHVYGMFRLTKPYHLLIRIFLCCGLALVYAYYGVKF